MQFVFDIECIIQDPKDKEQIRARITEKIRQGIWRKYNAEFALQIIASAQFMFVLVGKVNGIKRVSGW